MERIENPKIKEFLIEFASETLEQCTLFTQIFGNGFAHTRLEKNVQKVFTNEFSKTINGYQNSSDNSITLCTSNRDDVVLTVEQLQKDRNKLSTLLHEAVHAILSRDENECKKFNIVSGTGILEVMVNQQGENIEVGRGLNEGLTNWICGHAGYLPNSYYELTSFVCELELAIGSQRVMKLGKGNITKNVAKQLNMSKTECICFLMQADQVYQIKDQNLTLNNWKTILENYLQSNMSQDDDFKRNAIQEYEQLQKNDDYIEAICSNEYQKYLDNNSLEDSNETRIEYLKELITSNNKKLPDLIANVESKIFDKYFKKEWEGILKSRRIDTDTFFRFKALSEFFKKTSLGMQQNAQNSQNQLSQFLMQFEEVEEKYYHGISQLAEKDLKNGNLTLDRAIQLFQAASEIGDDKLYYLIGNISQIMYPEDASAVQSLLFKLQKDNRLEDIKEYYIHCANTENKRVYLFFRNGQLEFTSEDNILKKISVKDDVKKFNDVFDCTLMLDEDDQKIIKEFIGIKTAAEAKNPNANITISGRTIVVDFGDRINIYFIDKGMILPAKLEREKTIKVEFQSGRNNILPVKINKTSIINRVITRIKQLVFSYEQKENDDQTTTDVQDLEEDRASEFRKKYVANVETVNVDNFRKTNLHKNRENKQKEDKNL